MNIKTFMAAAVAALTLAACQAEQDEAALTTDKAISELEAETANSDAIGGEEGSAPKAE